MEIEGRECKEVKIGEHSYWFVEKYKGGDIRKVRILMTDESGHKSFTEKTIYSAMPGLFVVFCKRVDADIIPTEAFYDGLETEDSEILQDEVLRRAADVFPKKQPKKKTD